MRTTTVILTFLLAGKLFAQEQKDPYYLQQAPVQQMVLDCYAHHLDEGLAAQKRGDCRLALRWFRDAKSCPEAGKMPDRMEELDRLIAACESIKDKAGPAQAAPVRASVAETTGTSAGTIGEGRRRRFQPSRDFLNYDNPACYDITCKEAERAFRGGYWDDAAALYRAAKNCTDADQADRLAANQRIEACRTASQNELRRKEQEAVRQARHALAANRANDATQLLRAFDRSLAYRLADFANEYIAPDDNDACRQAMFDALYYTPSVHSGTVDENLRIPFCYQLGDNLDRDLQVHFLGKTGKQKICAFARSRNLLFQWNAETFEPEEPVSMEDTTLIACDVVPDGRTLLFWSANAFLFWRSPRETFRLPVQAVSLYCFDEKGQTFYFLNAAEMKIYALNLRDIFAQRKGSGQRSAPQPIGLAPGYGLLRLAYTEGKFWAGYRDSIEVFASGAGKGTWQREQFFPIGSPVRNYYTGELPYLWLNPAGRTAVFANDSAAYYFKVPEMESGVIDPASVLPGFPIAAGQDARFVATYYIGSANDKDSRLLLYDPESGVLKYAALIPTNQSDMHLRTGVFSPDNRQFATTTGGGRLEVWTLDDGPNQRTAQLGRDAYFALNADGTKLYAWRDDSLMQMPADDPGRVVQAAPAPPNSATGLIAGQDWIAYRTGLDSIVLTDRLGRNRWQLPSPPGYNVEIVAAFSPDESKFAYLAGLDSVVVRSLEDGRLVAARAFGGAVHQIYYVPLTEEIIVVQRVETEDFGNEQTVIKLWSPFQGGGAKLRAVQLHDYSTVEVALSAAGGLMAFTDGLDIRVFRQNDLLNEATRIRQFGLRMVTALAFHPDGNMLAAGYDDGSVVFWDINTGQARFTWAKPPIRENEDFPPVIRMRFSDGGRRLHMLLFGYVLLTRDVALSLVRAGVQTDYRKLISFLPNQIREYNLEQALDYPNNFTRLAASGDLPLIRSFFDYYRESAVYSNNIQRVGNYCNRAFVLFGQLDAATQNVLRPILLEMYEDYHWKLLLRGQAAEAEKVANSMIRDFGNPLSATLAAAHSALLRKDQRAATRLYADWALRSADQGANDGVIQQSALDSLHTRVRQLLEYDLLQPEQLGCLCDLFGTFPAYETLCADIPPGTALAGLDVVARLRWDIFHRLNTAAWVKNNPQKVLILEKALENARQLQRQNRTVSRQELEKVMLTLSQAYADWGIFEQSGARSLRMYNRAIEGLNANGTYDSPARETSRLSKLAYFYLYVGNAHLSTDRLPEAENAFQQGLNTANQLLQLPGADSARYQMLRNVYAALYTQFGITALLAGDAVAAQQAFEEAQNVSATGINNLYFGHVALLKDEDVEALLNYGDIYNEEILALTLFDIERMARQLPTQQARLLAFSERLRAARLAGDDQLDSTVVNFYFAEQKRQYFAGREQWDSTLFWNAVALRQAEQVLNQSQASALWQGKWLDAVLNQTYFLLFQTDRDTARLSEVIRYAQAAERYPDEGAFYYENRYLVQTNLAHALWLRQKPGDRELALQHYREFLQNNLSTYDPWELLLKDFRDLARAGVKWPDMAGLIQQIRPADGAITAEDWSDLGIRPPGER